MTNLPKRPTTGTADGAKQTILSGSRTLDGVSENATTIPAVAPHTKPCSDNADESANHPSTAPPAQTSRRGFIMNSIVSAAAVASATAIPSIAAGRTTVANPPLAVDPIFAAIEAHRAARQGYNQACDAHSEAEERGDTEARPNAVIKIGEFESNEMEEKDGGVIEFRPSGKMVPMYARSRSDIIRDATALDDDAKREDWIEARCKELEAEQDRLDAEWHQSGLDGFEMAMDTAYDVERDRAWELIWTMPTTALGLAALHAHIGECGGSISEMIHHDEWEEVIQWSMHRAVCALAGLPTPAMSNVVVSLAADNLSDDNGFLPDELCRLVDRLNRKAAAEGDE
jgi:hypothetical protein